MKDGLEALSAGIREGVVLRGYGGLKGGQTGQVLYG